MNAEKIHRRRLPLWAAARSVFGAACESAGKDARFLDPKLEENFICLGESGLAFSDSAFAKLIGTGFGKPNLHRFLSAPAKGLKTIFLLRRISKIFKQSDSIPSAINPILRAGLEATVAYMNHHPCAQKFWREKSFRSIRIEIRNHESKWMIMKESNEHWSIQPFNEKSYASACLQFFDLQTARKGALGLLDPLVSVGTGEIALSGQIPLLDKFGYFARLANLEVPRPRL